MKTAVTALTKTGSELALKIGPLIHADVYLKKEHMGREAGKAKEIEGGFMAFAGWLFKNYEALVFIMASGIVVRAIAPHIIDKKSDPAVVVLDEKGKHIISLLSGHVGGANALAREIAGQIGAVPVITTSTDVNEVIAFDVFAKENDCVIENFKDVKYISSQLVNGNKVGFYSDYGLSAPLPYSLIPLKAGIHAGCMAGAAVVLSNKAQVEVCAEKILWLRPKNLILGIGCRRGTPEEQIRNAIGDFLRVNGKSPLSVKCLATIDLKKDEEGLLEYCKDEGLELRIIQRDRIEAIEDGFTYSSFVKEKAGVGGVAEPCAVMAGEKATLICGKTVYKGITLALAEEEKEFRL